MLKENFLGIIDMESIKTVFSPLDYSRHVEHSMFVK